MLCAGSINTAHYERMFGGGVNTNHTSEKDQQTADYEAQKAIKQQLEDTALPKGFFVLLDDDFVTVLCKDGEATVTVKASANFVIPYVAEKFLPIAQDAAEQAGVTISAFHVDSYNKNKDGVVDGTWASWQTEDGSTGVLTDDTSGTAIVKPGLTIEQVYEYYSEYEDIVNDMIAEAGGGHE